VCVRGLERGVDGSGGVSERGRYRVGMGEGIKEAL
jgi:hypothetical protein